MHILNLHIPDVHILPHSNHNKRLLCSDGLSGITSVTRIRPTRNVAYFLYCSVDQTCYVKTTMYYACDYQHDIMSSGEH